MKTSKECTTCKHCEKLMLEQPCYDCSKLASWNDPSHEYLKWEPIETKKMKNIRPNRIIEVLKEMFTFSDSNVLSISKSSSIGLAVIILYTFIMNDKSIALLMLICWLLGYFSRRPHPNEKTLFIWLKICKLKVQIAILKKNLRPYPTLNKIKHQKYKSTREKVKEWRLELGELKRELKELM